MVLRENNIFAEDIRDLKMKKHYPYFEKLVYNIKKCVFILKCCTFYANRL